MTVIAPGVTIYQCPDCKTFFRSEENYFYLSFSSFNQYQENWTDENVNRKITSLNIAECKKCHYFFDYSKQAIGVVEVSKKAEHYRKLPKEIKVYPNVKDIEILIKLNLHNFSHLLTTDRHNDYDEMDVRKCIWQYYNNLIVDLYNEQDLLTFFIKSDMEEDCMRSKKNIDIIKSDIKRYWEINQENLKLSDILLQKKNPEQYQLRAEIKRHLGDFAGSRKILLSVSLENYHFVKQLRRKIRRRNKTVFELKDKLNTKIYKAEYFIEKIRKILGI